MAQSKGRFGAFGGQYIPETLMNAVEELDQAYLRWKDDPGFNEELSVLFNEYANRPSRLYYARKMTEDLGGAKIYLKRGGDSYGGRPVRDGMCSLYGQSGRGAAGFERL